MLKLGFAEKLDLFRKFGPVSKKEYETLDEFRKNHKRIIHEIGGGLFPIEESGQNEIMNNAAQSALITTSILERVTSEGR